MSANNEVLPKHSDPRSVINHISKLLANKVHTPDAAGNYHDYPITIHNRSL